MAAIIKSYYKNDKNIALTPKEIRRLIQISAQRDADEKTLHMGHGIINATKALAFLGADIKGVDDETLYYGSDGSPQSLVCYPNPFYLSSSNNTHCSFYLTASSKIQYWVYSRRGQLMDTQQRSLGIGKFDISWNGRDRNQSSVPTGVYQMVLKITPDNGPSNTKIFKHLITVFR